MKVLLDTNLIVDIALERQPYIINSETVLAFVEQEQIEGYISASTISDLSYLIRKQKGRDLTIEFLRQIVTFCQISLIAASVLQKHLPPLRPALYDIFAEIAQI